MPESRFSRLAPGLLAPGGVLDKAECAAQRALAAGVRNGQALWRLGTSIECRETSTPREICTGA